MAEVLGKGKHLALFLFGGFHEVVQQRHARLVGARLQQLRESVKTKPKRIASITALQKQACQLTRIACDHRP